MGADSINSQNKQPSIASNYMNEDGFIDPLKLAIGLMNCQSVTPEDGGALDLLEGVLQGIGFKTKRYKFDNIENIYAKLGDGAPNLCFAGHTDVVPTGDLNKWTYPPFDATIKDGVLYGRGSSDMKTGVAAFVAAAHKYSKENGTPDGAISLLITGDEEAAAINGTIKLLPAITKDGETLSHCIVGEPTCPNVLGDMIKNGRRGSLNCTIESSGTQGHVAYPHLAVNPIPPLLEFLSIMQNHVFDNGAEGFQPTNLEIVTIDVGNPATNIIPQTANARFNIRFNTNHSGASLREFISVTAKEIDNNFKGTLKVDISVSGEPFFTKAGKFTDIIQNAAKETVGIVPELSTTGGTSDARFIKDYCPVVEFGIVGKTLHKIDENVTVKEVYDLSLIYNKIISDYFIIKP